MILSKGTCIRELVEKKNQTDDLNKQLKNENDSNFDKKLDFLNL